MKMIHITSRGTYEVKQTGNRFFYYSRQCMRWMPVAKSKVKFVTETECGIQ